ncbi:hypothetical protein AOB47_172c [Listeria monocytogenes]|nr:hypothetical protein AOB47_172c [Listeria monocytogenes]
MSILLGWSIVVGSVVSVVASLVIWTAVIVSALAYKLGLTRLKHKARETTTGIFLIFVSSRL